MSEVSVASRSWSPLADAKFMVKAMLRRVVPVHLRFRRSGELFFKDGEREVHELAKLVEPGTVAVDVGAHIGEYSYSICKHIGAKGRVIAIEPIAQLATQIQQASKRLGLPIEVINCALSATAGEADLLIPVETGKRKLGFATLEPRTATGNLVRIAVRRLDDICAAVDGRISFIKIDVEGHELQVLRGAVETLRRHRPNLLIEIEQRHSSLPIEQTFEFLEAQGYQGEFLDTSNQRQPLRMFDKVQHQTPREEWIGTPRYVSNFIFSPIA